MYISKLSHIRTEPKIQKVVRPLFSLDIICIYMYEDQKCKKNYFSAVPAFCRKRTFKTGKLLKIGMEIANFKIDL